MGKRPFIREPRGTVTGLSRRQSLMWLVAAWEYAKQSQSVAVGWYQFIEPRFGSSTPETPVCRCLNRALLPVGLQHRHGRQARFRQGPDAGAAWSKLPSLACHFRKRHPEINLHYSWFKFPVLADRFPVPSQKFPVLPSREFRSKPLNLLACRLSESRLASGFDVIPC